MWLVVTLFLALTIALSEWQVRDPMARTLLRLYLGWWGVCLVASTLDPMGIDPVSPFAYLLLLLNVGGFTTGFALAGRGVEPVVGSEAFRPLFRKFDHDLLVSRGVLVFLVASGLYLLRYAVRFIAAVVEAGPFEARNLRFGVGPVFGSAAELLIYNTFAEALAIGLVVLVAYVLVLGNARSWTFAAAVLDLVLFAIIGAGRTILVQAGVFVAVLAILRRSLQPGDRHKSLLAWVVTPAVVGAGAMLLLTMFRLFSVETGLEILQDGDVLRVSAEALVENLWSYAIGPFRALDQAIQHPSRYGYQFGRLTFGAIDELVGYPLRMLGVNYKVMNNEIGLRLQDVIEVGSGEFNALYTAVFRFYYDFGVPGVVVLSGLFGFLVRGAVLWFQSCPSPWTLGALLFLFGAALLSMQTWHLAGPGAFSFLVLAPVLRRLLEGPCPGRSGGAEGIDEPA